MTAQHSLKNTRIGSIDLVRGIIMVVMALDHVRDLLHKGAGQRNPLDLATTTPVLFFTRWITHFCAPGFVFLAGISACLYGFRKGSNHLRSFLISRGLWLILIDIVIMTLILTCNPNYNMIIFSVLWAIGISMILLGLLYRLPWKALLITGLIIVFGHNLLDPINPLQSSATGIIWDFIHATPSVIPLSKTHVVLMAYSFLPWTGVMMLGFVTGKLFEPSFAAAKRRRILWFSGLGAILIFIGLRLLNIYGDPLPWSVQKNGLFSLMSFLNTNKYPPSLLFLCMTLGPVSILLALFEHSRSRLAGFFITYGKVPFFYYIIHFFLIRIISLFTFFLSGFGIKDISTAPFYFHPATFGINLTHVYAVWVGVVLLMFPLCKWYGNYKRRHKNKWWLSYL